MRKELHNTCPTFIIDHKLRFLQKKELFDVEGMELFLKHQILPTSVICMGNHLRMDGPPSQKSFLTSKSKSISISAKRGQRSNSYANL